MRHEEYDSLLLSKSGSLCYICDIETYEMLHMTRGGMAIYGLTSAEEYEGKKCYELLQGLDKPCHFCTNCKLAEGQEYRWEYYNEKLGRWFDATDTLMRLDGRLYRMEVAQDITARNSLLSDKLSLEDVMYQCLHTLVSEEDFHTAVDLFLEAIGEYYNADRSYIFEFDLERQVMDNTFEWCRPGVSPEIGNMQKLPLALVEDWIQRFEDSGMFSIRSTRDEVDNDSDKYRILSSQGVRSLIATPLFRDGRIVGFMGVDDPAQNRESLTLLHSVSEFVLAELEKRRLLIELKHLSYTDILTGLSNRNHYAKTVSQYQAAAPNSLGMISISVNGLKSINESFGQKYGDGIIIRVADHIRSNLYGDAYRIGGDEFIVFCPDIERDPFISMVKDLHSMFLEETEYSVSIGYAWGGGQELNVNALLLQADERMRAEKQQYYHTEFEKRGRIRTSAGDVFEDIREGRFMVWYQPQVDLQTGAIIGAEALVRKQGSNGQIIPPLQFIPYYEARNVIQHLDFHVLDMVLAAIRKLRDQGLDLKVSVNFSRSSLLVPDFAASILAVCDRYGVPPSNLTIEVTETISTIGREALRELLEDIHKAGLNLSLDDFGSKYSNLAILTDFDFDEVKFDKALVDDICKNTRGRVILKNLIHMCRELSDIHIVAEGIEQTEQSELLHSYLCDYGQGYYFYKPMPLEQLVPLLGSPAEQPAGS